MRLMIDTLTRNNDDYKVQNTALINELELLKEKYQIVKQNLDKSMRDTILIKDEFTKGMFVRSTTDKEIHQLTQQVNELTVAKKTGEDKIEFLTGRVNHLQVELRR
jgi:prefoldin subunit 5